MPDRPVTMRPGRSEGRTQPAAALATRRSPMLRGRALLAESDGVAIAAISCRTGLVTADRFRHTAHAVHVLRLRRYRLLRQDGDDAPAGGRQRHLV